MSKADRIPDAWPARMSEEGEGLLTTRGSWTRDQRLAAIVKERGLSTRGFRRALRQLVADFTPLSIDPEELDEGDTWDRQEAIEWEFQEWFGDCRTVPAAFKIRHEGTGDGIHDYTVEVYEVEGTAEISEEKLKLYSDIADGDGPHCELHVLDKYDHELVVESDDLASFWVWKMYAERSPRPDRLAVKREWLKDMRQKATAQHHVPVVIDEQGAADRKREIAGLKRQLARANHSQIAGLLQDVIYGLGLGQSHKAIAQRVSVAPAVIRATSRLLTANRIDPKDIVKDTHARWKAAYDAVRELGVQL